MLVMASYGTENCCFAPTWPYFSDETKGHKGQTNEPGRLVDITLEGVDAAITS